jgi:hypothetical protein
VFIAMAGQHQVWQYDTTTGIAATFSGNGYERNQNGSSVLTTSWAQPSGLALAPSGDALFVAGALVCAERACCLGLVSWHSLASSLAPRPSPSRIPRPQTARVAQCGGWTCAAAAARPAWAATPSSATTCSGEHAAAAFCCG